MSARLVGAVLDAALPPTWKLILLAIADRIAGGDAYTQYGDPASQADSLAWRTGLPEPAVRRALMLMRHAGIVLGDAYEPGAEPSQPIGINIDALHPPEPLERYRERPAAERAAQWDYLEEPPPGAARMRSDQRMLLADATLSPTALVLGFLVSEMDVEQGLPAGAGTHYLGATYAASLLPGGASRGAASSALAQLQAGGWIALAAQGGRGRDSLYRYIGRSRPLAPPE